MINEELNKKSVIFPSRPRNMPTRIYEMACYGWKSITYFRDLRKAYPMIARELYLDKRPEVQHNKKK